MYSRAMSILSSRVDLSWDEVIANSSKLETLLLADLFTSYDCVEDCSNWSAGRSLLIPDPFLGARDGDGRARGSLVSRCPFGMSFLPYSANREAWRACSPAVLSLEIVELTEVSDVGPPSRPLSGRENKASLGIAGCSGLAAGEIPEKRGSWISDSRGSSISL